jgi:hypothetical protein
LTLADRAIAVVYGLAEIALGIVGLFRIPIWRRHDALRGALGRRPVDLKTDPGPAECLGSDSRRAAACEEIDDEAAL